jgi:hypothetical protein
MGDPLNPCEAIAADMALLDASTGEMHDAWHERPEALGRLVERAEQKKCDGVAQRLRWEALLRRFRDQVRALIRTDPGEKAHRC